MPRLGCCRRRPVCAAACRRPWWPRPACCCRRRPVCAAACRRPHLELGLGRAVHHRDGLGVDGRGRRHARAVPRVRARGGGAGGPAALGEQVLGAWRVAGSALRVPGSLEGERGGHRCVPVAREPRKLRAASVRAKEGAAIVPGARWAPLGSRSVSLPYKLQLEIGSPAAAFRQLTAAPAAPLTQHPPATHRGPRRAPVQNRFAPSSAQPPHGAARRSDHRGHVGRRPLLVRRGGARRGCRREVRAGQGAAQGRPGEVRGPLRRGPGAAHQGARRPVHQVRVGVPGGARICRPLARPLAAAPRGALEGAHPIRSR